MNVYKYINIYIYILIYIYIYIYIYRYIYISIKNKSIKDLSTIKLVFLLMGSRLLKET